VNGLSARRVEVVPLRRRHLRGVLRIEALSYARPWTASMFLGELAQRATRSYYVALARGEVGGYAGLMLTPDGAHVTTVAVDPARRRSGIATLLMCRLHEEALARGCDAMTLEVRASNVGARTLYEQLGYEAAGTRRGYYSDNGEDAIVMWAYGIGGDAHRELVARLRADVDGSTV
jgi:ribosomal-protein-alanine N-acetyltransferase